MADSSTVLIERGRNWDAEETKALLRLWADDELQNSFKAIKRTRPLWAKIAANLVKLGYDRTWAQCRTRIGNLVQEYRRDLKRRSVYRYRSNSDVYSDVSNSNGSSASSSNYCNVNNICNGNRSFPYFEIMDRVFGGKSVDKEVHGFMLDTTESNPSLDFEGDSEEISEDPHCVDSAVCTEGHDSYPSAGSECEPSSHEEPALFHNILESGLENSRLQEANYLEVLMDERDEQPVTYHEPSQSPSTSPQDSLEETLPRLRPPAKRKQKKHNDFSQAVEHMIKAQKEMMQQFLRFERQEAEAQRQLEEQRLKEFVQAEERIENLLKKTFSKLEQFCGNLTLQSTVGYDKSTYNCNASR